MIMNTFDEIIQTKAFSDLTPKELEVIRELVSSEEEYNEMKSFFNGISQLAVSSREEISGSVKSSLNSIFQAKHPGISQSWSAPNEAAPKKITPIYSQNWFRVAALLVLSAGITTLWISFSENQVTDPDTTKTTTASNTPQKPGQINEEATKKESFPIDSTNPKEYTASSEAAENQDAEEKEQNTPASPGNFPAGTYSVTVSGKNHAAAPSIAWSGASTYNQSTNQFDENSKQEDSQDSFSKAGMDADLNPMSAGHINSDISTDDLLSLIEPSF